MHLVVTIYKEGTDVEVRAAKKEVHKINRLKWKSTLYFQNRIPFLRILWKRESVQRQCSKCNRLYKVGRRNINAWVVKIVSD